jgi:hypothetical protein
MAVANMYGIMAPSGPCVLKVVELFADLQVSPE